MTARERLARLRRDDDGFTLTELVVSMAVLAVVMLLTTGAVLQASSVSARVDAAGAAQQQAHQAFGTLDRQVRWAAGFSRPGTVDGSPYVEWLDTASGAATCHQLRLDVTTGRLQQRSWAQGDTTTITPWRVLASGVSAVDARTPVFTLLPPDPTYAAARLRIAFTATAGGSKLTDTASQDVTYTALNSTSGAVPTDVCTEGRTLA